jgi:MoaA/NifB/PqqE/SkfB family radical SAM enzyme
VILAEGSSQLRDARQSTGGRVEIVKNPDTGLPDYSSGYLEASRRVRLRILSALRDPVQRKSLDLDALWRLRADFPVSACFNIHSYCNEACVMCPHRDYSDKSTSAVMSESLFQKLIEEFAYGGGRILTFNNFSEIFAHPRGVEFVEQALGYPELQVYIVTNGLHMTSAYVDRLVAGRFSGIVYASCHAFSAKTFRRVTRVDGFTRVLDNITYLARKHSAPERVIIQYATDFSSDAEVAAAREYWSSLGVSMNVFASHTFAGNSPHRQERSSTGTLAGCVGWGHDAGQPFYQVVVQSDGDLTLCCHDLANSVVLGNCADSSICDVWNSERFYEVIGQIYLGEPSSGDLVCRKCCLAQYVEV